MRLDEVAVGTISCVAVSGAFDLGLPWYAGKGTLTAVPSVPSAATQLLQVALRPIGTVLGVQGALAMGLALLPLTRGAAIACMLALSLGVWVGCHVQTGLKGATYIGRQFTIAFIMVFVQDHGWSTDPGPALTRLSGILAGIVVLAVVMLITRRFPGA
jgi:hypothetical protein